MDANKLVAKWRDEVRLFAHGTDAASMAAVEESKLRCADELEAALAEPAGEGDAALQKVYAAFGIGEQARSLSCLLTNIQNAQRFADYLHAVEREFFMVPGEPDDDFPDDEPQDECLLNCWGSTREEYIEQFRAALARLSTPPAPLSGGVEAAAIKLWHRFAPEHVERWEDECEQAVYLDAAADVIGAAPLSGEGDSTAAKLDSLLGRLRPDMEAAPWVIRELTAIRATLPLSGPAGGGTTWRCTKRRFDDGGVWTDTKYAKTRADMLILEDQGYAIEPIAALPAWTNAPTERGWYWHDEGDVMRVLFVCERPGHSYLAVQEDAHPVTGKRHFRMADKMGGRWLMIAAPSPGAAEGVA